MKIGKYEINLNQAIVGLAVLVDIQGAIGKGSVSLTNMVPADWIPGILAWNAFLAFVGTTIMGALAMPGALAGRSLRSVSPSTAAKVLIAAIALSMFLFVDPANAGTAQLGPIGQKIVSAFDKSKAAVTGQPADDPKAALPCMDVTVLTKLTLANLVPTMKACVQDLNNQLVTDTQRALDSAKNYAPTGKDKAMGDNDAVNCLSPALALFQAAAIVPAVPATPEVLNTHGSVKTPATNGTPELKPGPILLFQKYREFTIAGGLTSCQTWVNGPVNATAAAGVAGAGTALVGAALLAK